MAASAFCERFFVNIRHCCATMHQKCIARHVLFAEIFPPFFAERSSRVGLNFGRQVIPTSHIPSLSFTPPPARVPQIRVSLTERGAEGDRCVRAYHAPQLQPSTASSVRLNYAISDEKTKDALLLYLPSQTEVRPGETRTNGEVNGIHYT